MRTRIATDLHDDIGSSLTQIVILSEVARQHIPGSASPIAEPLTRITGVSNELVEAMSDIVWAINPKKDHLADLVQRMRRFASDVFASGHIRLNLQAPATSADVQLGANVRREVFLIFKESVNNIARHSACSEVQVEFDLEDDHLILKLADNGRGFDPAELQSQNETPKSDWSKGGNGLSSMRRRARELGGEFDIRSEPGKGTNTTLKVPLGRYRSGDTHPNGR